MKITTQQQADAVEVQLIAADALKAANMQIPGDSQTLDEYRTALAAWKRRDEFDPANVGELSETAKHYFAWTNLTDKEHNKIHDELSLKGLWGCPNSAKNRAAYAKWLSEQSEFKPGDLVIGSCKELRIITGMKLSYCEYSNGNMESSESIRKVTRVTHLMHGPGTVLDTREDKYVLVQWDCGHTGEHKLEELKAL